MKCFKLTICFILLAFSLSGFGAIYEITPTEKSEIATGDFITVKITSSDGKLPELKGKRIGGVLYVMKQDEDRLDVIVAPPTQAEDELKESEDRYILKGFSYEPKQSEKIQSYLTEDFDYTLGEDSWPMGLVLLIIMIALLLGGAKLIKKQRAKSLIKRRRKEKADELLNWTKSVDSREALEQVSLRINEIKEHLDYSIKDLNNYLSDLDAVQFKREWSEEDSLTVRKSYRKFANGLKVKSGI